MGKGEDTRAMILDKAAIVLNQKGYYATSLADLMRVTGLEKGGIYNHFASKEELAVATFSRVVTQIRRAFIESIRDKRGAVERLEAVFSIFGRVARGFPVAGGCPVMNTAIETDCTNEVLRDLARAAMDDWRRFLASVLRSGVERGELSVSGDPESLADYAVSTLEGSIMLATLYGNPKMVDNAAAHVLQHLTRGE